MKLTIIILFFGGLALRAYMQRELVRMMDE